MIILEHGYTIFFTVEVAGVATAADSTPTATLYRNGSASGVTVTVATTAVTGLYKATFTTLAVGDGWAKTDVLHLTVAAAIASTSGYVAVVWDSTGDVDAVMRGTDGANTTAPANADIAAILEDTSTTLPAQIAGITSGAGTISDEDIQEIVAGVTAVAPRICDSSAGTFRMTAGDTWIQDFTVTTTGADKFIVAVKNDAADDDTAAVLLIDSVDGLERINGAVPASAGDASIATGAATITATVQSNITLMIVPGKYVVTVKKLDVGSDVTAISTASLTVFSPGVSEIST